MQSIDCLPDNVMEAILVHLPIRDAVRTSLLSRNWRYRWNSISQLVFDTNSFPKRAGQVRAVSELELVKFVERVLLLHDGPIDKFKLSTMSRGFININIWIRVLLRKGIKELTLQFCSGGQYKVPRRLFDCETMIHLQLSNCVVKFPPAFTGLHGLETLDLQDVTILCTEGETLIDWGSLLLKKLVLKRCGGCSRLTICTPHLREMLFEGSLDYLHLENTPMLAVAYVKMSTEPKGRDALNREPSNLIRALGGLPSIERLEIHSWFLRFLAVGDVPEKLPVTWENLKNLSVDINFWDMVEITAMFCLFRSSPALERLRLNSFSNKEHAIKPISRVRKSEEGISCRFAHLRIMDLTQICGVKPEMAIVEFILASAPVLELVRIKIVEDESQDLYEVNTLLQELLSFPRSSARAKILLVK